MPPINDSGYELVLGPDQDGRFVTVPQGDQFEHPTPPKTVSELEADEAAADALAPAPTPKKTKPAQDTEASQ